MANKGFSDPAILAKAQATRARNKAIKEGRPVPVAIPQSTAQTVTDVRTAPPLDSANPPRDLLSGSQMAGEFYSKSGDRLNPIPGYATYLAVDRDQGARLALFRASGWEHVKTDEVLMNDGQYSGDEAGNVRMWSKETGPNGTPIYQYLMKKPLWLKERHDADRERVHAQIEAKIKGGAKSGRAEDAQYAPGELQGSKLPSVQIDSKLYQPR